MHRARGPRHRACGELPVPSKGEGTKHPRGSCSFPRDTSGQGRRPVGDFSCRGTWEMALNQATRLSSVFGALAGNFQPVPASCQPPFSCCSALRLIFMSPSTLCEGLAGCQRVHELIKASPCPRRAQTQKQMETQQRLRLCRRRLGAHRLWIRSVWA